MTIKRVGIAVGLLFAAMGNVSAEIVTPSTPVACVANALQAYFGSSFDDETAVSTATALTSAALVSDLRDDQVEAIEDAVATNAVIDPRQELTDFAMQLLDIRYRRGGRAPSTGFDCSGFVHYVFAQVLGVDLPQNSQSQYQIGAHVARADMKTGDLVFFKTHGKRISHVGIYLGDGRFIHSPTTGERVRVSNLSENYWARRFAGARRPSTFI
ncbi:MAG: C40 family peptidase [Rudaea sp.]